jgi:hypothetical protein
MSHMTKFWHTKHITAFAENYDSGVREPNIMGLMMDTVAYWISEFEPGFWNKVSW